MLTCASVPLLCPAAQRKKVSLFSLLSQWRDHNKMQQASRSKGGCHQLIIPESHPTIIFFLISFFEIILFMIIFLIMICLHVQEDSFFFFH
jgi:ATP-dependent Zn protease